MTLVTLTGIAKRFGVVQALKGVSLDLPAATVTALVGENGAGKSTLMRILEGEHAPDQGSIAVDGRPVALRLGARGARGRHPHRPPGTGDHPRAVGGREHLHRRPQGA